MLRGHFIVKSAGVCRSEWTIVEERAVGPISKAKAELGAVLKSIVGRGDPPVIGNAVVVCAGAKKEGPFRIPHEVFISTTGVLGVDAPVVVFIGPVAIASIPVGDEIIGIVGGIAPDGEIGILGAIRVESTSFEKSSIASGVGSG